jgi:replicative DNA helicase
MWKENKMAAPLTRVPPYSDEAEKSVLGCMLLDKDAITIAAHALRPEDFYSDQNRWIFEAIVQISRRGGAVDFVTLIDRLNSEGVIEKIGASYIAALEDIVPSTKNIEQYCRIVSEKAALRDIILNFGNMIADCYDAKKPLSEIIDEAQRYIYDLSMNKAKSTFVSLKDSVKPLIVKLAELYRRNEAMTGVATGFRELDDVTNGFQPSDLILIAARPSMGKTALGLNIAQNAAILYKKTVAFFSLEMSCEQLVMRILSSETKVDSVKIKKGNQSNSDWKKLTDINSLAQESDIELYIDDTSGITPGEILSKLRKLKSTKGLDMVVIDYLQMMTTNARTENRQQEIASITRDLKAIAKELAVPVVTLSQLSRGPEARSDKRPILSDLRESGAIEQDADIVMFLYRPGYYDKANDPSETELIIAKHRNGETKTVRLKFMPQFTKFEDSPKKPVEEDAYGL